MSTKPKSTEEKAREQSFGLMLVAAGLYMLAPEGVMSGITTLGKQILPHITEFQFRPTTPPTSIFDKKKPRAKSKAKNSASKP